MSLKQEFELLRRVPIFADIEPAKLKLLAFMSERVGFDPGKQLMRQGDPADAAYLIIDGHAEVIAETPAGPVILATLGANEIVGEMGILCNVPRNATVCAKDRLIATWERGWVAELLKRASGNVSRAAKLGQLDRVSLHRLMKKHGIPARED